MCTQLPVNIFDDEYAAYDEVDGEVISDDENKWSVNCLFQPLKGAKSPFLLLDSPRFDGE